MPIFEINLFSMIESTKKKVSGSQFFFRALVGGTSCLIPQMLYTIVILSLSKIFEQINLKKGQAFTEMIQKHTQYSTDRIVKYIPSRALSVIIYRALVINQPQLKQKQKIFLQKYSKFVFAGLSGFLSLFVMYPFERHKILIVSDISEGQKLRQKGHGASFVAYWRFKRMYKGFLEPGLILSGNRLLYFGVYDQLIQKYLNTYDEPPSFTKTLQFSSLSYLFAEIFSVSYWYSKKGYLPFERMRLLKNYFKKSNFLNFSIIALYDKLTLRGEKQRF